MLPVGKVDPDVNGPDDSADGPERLDIEDRCLEFFIFVSICSILLTGVFRILTKDEFLQRSRDFLIFPRVFNVLHITPA